jgi:hypothetical protein
MGFCTQTQRRSKTIVLSYRVHYPKGKTIIDIKNVFQIQTYKRKAFSYFVQGLLLLAPVYITGYIIFNLLSSLLDEHFYFHFRGTGLVVLLAIIMVVGFWVHHFWRCLSSRFLKKGFPDCPCRTYLFLTQRLSRGWETKKFNQPYYLR